MYFIFKGFLTANTVPLFYFVDEQRSSVLEDSRWFVMCPISNIRRTISNTHVLFCNSFIML